MCEFVERILTVEDQQALSAQWYGDAHYSEHEVLETTGQEVIKRNGRELTVKSFNDLEGFKYVTKADGYNMMGDLGIYDPNQDVQSNEVMFDEDLCFDVAFYLDEDENFFYFEGELNNFIYEVPCSQVLNFKKESLLDFLSVLDDPAYSPDREMTDYEMDVLL